MWRQTWFGARLGDDELAAALAPQAKARDVQHGIEEVTQRFAEGRQSAHFAAYPASPDSDVFVGQTIPFAGGRAV